MRAVGSESVNGAGSNILEHILKRIFLAFCPGDPRDLYELAVRKSFLVSADMAHACHPNYAYVLSLSLSISHSLTLTHYLKQREARGSPCPCNSRWCRRQEQRQSTIRHNVGIGLLCARACSPKWHSDPRVCRPQRLALRLDHRSDVERARLPYG